jgi:hypothetical protein
MAGEGGVGVARGCSGVLRVCSGSGDYKEKGLVWVAEGESVCAGLRCCCRSVERKLGLIRHRMWLCAM